MNDLIDTNILFYAVDSSDERKHGIAKMLVKKAFYEGAYISTQNLAEFYQQTKRKLTEVQFADTKKIVLAIIKSDNWIKISYDQNTIYNAIMKDQKKDDFWDVLIYFTALENGVTRILTENTKDFEGLEGVVAANPFG